VFSAICARESHDQLFCGFTHFIININNNILTINYFATLHTHTDPTCGYGNALEKQSPIDVQGSSGGGDTASSIVTPLVVSSNTAFPATMVHNDGYTVKLVVAPT
jgi:hypothetical protein